MLEEMTDESETLYLPQKFSSPVWEFLDRAKKDGVLNTPGMPIDSKFFFYTFVHMVTNSLSTSIHSYFECDSNKVKNVVLLNQNF